MKHNTLINIDNDHNIWPILSWSLILLFITISIYTLPNSMYLADQAEHFSRALDYITLQDLTPLGPNISGTQAHIPGPAYYLLISLPLLIYKSPFSSVLIIILLHTLAMILWEVQGRKCGLNSNFRFIVILIGGFSWAAIAFSTHIWNPNLFFIITTLIFISFLKIKSNTASGWWVVLLPVVSVAPQFHLTGLIYWPFVIIMCLLFKLAPRGKYFVYGILFAIIIWIPYLSYEIVTSFHNTKAMLSANEKIRLIDPRFSKTIIGSIKNCTLEESDHRAPEKFYYKISRFADFRNTKGIYFSFVDILVFTSFSVAIIISISKIPRSSNEFLLAVVGLSILVLNSLFMSWTRRDFLPHYALMALLGTSILIAIGLERILKGLWLIVLIPWPIIALSNFPSPHLNSVASSVAAVEAINRNVPDGNISFCTTSRSLENQLGSIMKGLSPRYKKEAGEWLILYGEDDLRQPPDTLLMWDSMYKETGTTFDSGKKNIYLYKKDRPLKVLRPDKAISNTSMDKIKFVYDNDLYTRWDTGHHFEPDDYIEFLFDSPTKLSALSFDYHISPHDFPNKPELSVLDMQSKWHALSYKPVKLDGIFIVFIDESDIGDYRGYRLRANEMSSSYYWSIHEARLYAK